jgi:hypothetical protein
VGRGVVESRAGHEAESEAGQLTKRNPRRPERRCAGRQAPRHIATSAVAGEEDVLGTPLGQMVNARTRASPDRVTG